MPQNLEETKTALMESLGVIDQSLYELSKERVKEFFEEGKERRIDVTTKNLLQRRSRSTGHLRMRLAALSIKPIVREVAKKHLDRAESNISEDDATYLVYGAMTGVLFSHALDMIPGLLSALRRANSGRV